jgi:ABC-2 type transport system ATP-binding protein
LRVVVDGSAILVDLVDETPFDLVRDTVVELGLALVRMEQRRHRLEDLFRDNPAVRIEPGAAAAGAVLAVADPPPPPAGPRP